MVDISKRIVNISMIVHDNVVEIIYDNQFIMWYTDIRFVFIRLIGVAQIKQWEDHFYQIKYKFKEHRKRKISKGVSLVEL